MAKLTVSDVIFMYILHGKSTLFPEAVLTIFSNRLQLVNNNELLMFMYSMVIRHCMTPRGMGSAAVFSCLLRVELMFTWSIRLCYTCYLWS